VTLVRVFAPVIASLNIDNAPTEAEI
jgi:hypothetical protein